jgi:adenylate cyclase
VVERMAADLVAAGVPLDRLAAFVRTLHPQVAGRSFVWSAGQPVVVTETPWAVFSSPAFTRSAMQPVFEGSSLLRVRLGVETPTHPDLQKMKAEGYTDWVACGLRFISGGSHAITFSSRRPGGFSDEQVEWLRQISRALTRLAEVLALMRTATNLLSAYVGRNAGSRVLAGQVQRGEVENIASVVWFSDLRGFTSLSGALTPQQIIGVLNELFDCQVPAIEAQGGEVLKFIGDGMLAIFPFGPGRTAGEACSAALEATRGAFAALEALNEKRKARGDPALRFGIGLHLGEVAYGNIGGAARVDFTCIGSTVNIASRIEGLTGKLGHAVLVSEAVAKTGAFPTQAVGSFELKGVEQPQQVFAPVQPAP